MSIKVLRKLDPIFQPDTLCFVLNIALPQASVSADSTYAVSFWYFFTN